MIPFHPDAKYPGNLLAAIEKRTNNGQTVDLAVGIEVGRRLPKNPRLEHKIAELKRLVP